MKTMDIHQNFRKINKCLKYSQIQGLNGAQFRYFMYL